MLNVGVIAGITTSLFVITMLLVLLVLVAAFWRRSVKRLSDKKTHPYRQAEVPVGMMQTLLPSSTSGGEGTQRDVAPFEER